MQSISRPRRLPVWLNSEAARAASSFTNGIGSPSIVPANDRSRESNGPQRNSLHATALIRSMTPEFIHCSSSLFSVVLEIRARIRKLVSR